MEENKDKTSKTQKPKIGKALKVGATPNEDEQTSEKVEETEESKDNVSLLCELSLRDKIIILVACIACCLVILYAYINRGNNVNVKRVPKVETVDTSAESDMADTVFVKVDDSAPAENEQSAPIDDQEVLRKDLDGSNGSQSLNELQNNYTLVGSWSIASGFGSGKVVLYKKGSKYCLDGL